MHCPVERPASGASDGSAGIAAPERHASETAGQRREIVNLERPPFGTTDEKGVLRRTARHAFQQAVLPDPFADLADQGEIAENGAAFDVGG